MFGKVKSMRELFGIELSYAYDCEQKLVEKGLPKMIQNASSTELRTALENHLQETRTHVSRLQRVFSSVGMEPDTKTNDILDEMTTAADDSISNIDPSPLRDAALIINGNLVEHYEIATYGTVRTWAEMLDQDNAVDLLQQTLDEESETDEKLTEIAESTINATAANE